MTVFESKENIRRPVEEVYAFLADFNNHEQLMPEMISDWRSNADEASFSIQNMAKLALKISNRIANTSVIIVPGSQVPFHVEMRWLVADMGDNTTEVVLTVSAELNMMMKMMASGPLKKLTEHEVATLKKALS